MNVYNSCHRIVCHRYQRLAVLQMFLSLFWFEQEKTLKSYSKKLYASTIKRKGEGETKVAIGT